MSAPECVPIRLRLDVVSDLVYVSFSELDALRQCPLKHQLAYLEGWSGGEGVQRGLTIGTLWHAVMADHYRYIRDHRGYVLEPGQVTEKRVRKMRVYEAVRPWFYTATGEQGVGRVPTDRGMDVQRIRPRLRH